MVKEQPKKLEFIDLLNQLVFIQGRAKDLKLTDEQLQKLNFVKQDVGGKVEYINSYKLNLAKSGDEIVILILNE